MRIKTRTLGFALLIGAASIYYFTDCCDAIASIFIVIAYCLEAVSKTIPRIELQRIKLPLQVVAFAFFLQSLAFDGDQKSTVPLDEISITYVARLRWY